MQFLEHTRDPQAHQPQPLTQWLLPGRKRLWRGLVVPHFTGGKTELRKVHFRTSSRARVGAWQAWPHLRHSPVRCCHNYHLGGPRACIHHGEGSHRVQGGAGTLHPIFPPILDEGEQPPPWSAASAPAALRNVTQILPLLCPQPFRTPTSLGVEAQILLQPTNSCTACPVPSMTAPPP